MNSEVLVFAPLILTAVAIGVLKAWPRQGRYQNDPHAGESNDGYSQRLRAEWEASIRNNRRNSSNSI